MRYDKGAKWEGECETSALEKRRVASAWVQKSQGKRVFEEARTKEKKPQKPKRRKRSATREASTPNVRRKVWIPSATSSAGGGGGGQTEKKKKGKKRNKHNPKKKKTERRKKIDGGDACPRGWLGKKRERG